MDENHHAARPGGIRASVDGFASTFVPKKRYSYAAHSPTASRAFETTIDDWPDNGNTTPTSAKDRKSIMSFFTRLGSRGRSSVNLSIKGEQTPRGSSVPSTPLPLRPGTATVKHSISIPAFPSRDDAVPLSPDIMRPAETFPLCVARLQAIHTVILPAGNMPSEVILKRSTEKERWREKRARPWGHAATRSTEMQWTRKLFVLVPGFLLQYAGDATEDCVPEKVLQLTPTTVAFASDAIEHRPWVLAVYGNSADDTIPVPEHRRTKFLSKVSRKGSWQQPKTCATALLLVFECAEAMDEWMGLIRTEAKRLAGGGIGEAVTSGQEEHADQLHADDDEKIDPLDASRNTDHRSDDATKLESSDENRSRRESVYYRSSTDATRSVATQCSEDQNTLDQLRGPSRLSIHSGGGRGRLSMTSPDTSPDRASSIATKTRRKSAALSTRSRSSVELRPSSRSQRPVSIVDKDGNILSAPRTPSPSTSFSPPVIQWPPADDVPPVPATPTSIKNMPILVESPWPAPRPRPVSAISNPSSPSTKKHSPTQKRRPVSMVDTRTHIHHAHSHTHSGASTASDPLGHHPFGSQKRKKPHHGPVSITIPHPHRTRSLKRRSLTTLVIPPDDEDAVSAAMAGPAPHPPPNIPLPELPSHSPDAGAELLSKSLPGPGFISPRHLHSPKGRRKSRDDRPASPRIPKQPSFRKLRSEEVVAARNSVLGPGRSGLSFGRSLSPESAKIEFRPVLEKRHSFHAPASAPLEQPAELE